MPSTSEQIVAAGAVILVAVGVMVYNTLATASQAKARVAAAAKPGGVGVQPPTWVGRYVQSHGDVVGQVVALEGDTVVVRKGAVTLVVPRSKVKEQGLDLGLAAGTDLVQAEKDGAAWKGA